MDMIPDVAPAAQREAEEAGPLQGLRVLDFGHTIMGPSCGLVLADLGAEVIRVEPPEGDRTRRLGGFAAGFFGVFNRNKRSIGLDLKTEGGRATAERLVAGADVLIENFAPGTMERLGLDWPRLREVNPRLVYCALKGYLPGPYEHLHALDEVVQMQAGLAYMTGPPGRPLRAGASVIDIMGGVFGVVAILAALRERERTGKGQLVRSALFESTTFLVAQHIAGAALTGGPVPPMPARQGGAWCIYDVFQAADAPVFVGVTSEQHWQRFCASFPLGELATDPRLATHDDRVRARAWMLPRLGAIFATLPAAEILARCRAALLPCALVARPDELVDDPQFNSEGASMEVWLNATTRARLPALPVELGGRRPGLRRQPPAAGADTHDVLAEAGLSLAEIEGLQAAGVIRPAPLPAEQGKE